MPSILGVEVVCAEDLGHLASGQLRTPEGWFMGSPECMEVAQFLPWEKHRELVNYGFAELKTVHISSSST